MLLTMANKRRNSSWTFANISMIICFGIAIPTTESFSTAPPAGATETLPTTGSQCLSSMKNIAVREGHPNTIINLYNDPQRVSWRVYPTSDELDPSTIIDYGGVRNPTLTGLYDVNQTGLIVKDATTKATEDGNIRVISTAGLYVGQCANNTNKTGAKLLVVRSGPQCSCTPSDYTFDVSCNVTFADSSYHPIYPIVTWKLNGVIIASYTLRRMQIDPYVYVIYAESTITNCSVYPANYKCELTFAAPAEIQFPYIAVNAPEFNESCSLQECSEPLSATQDTVTTLSPVVTTTPSTTAFPISMDPLFGPIAGGTNITIIGSIAIGDVSRYVGSIVTGIRNVYIGKDLSSTFTAFLPTDGPTFELVAVTPNTTEASVGQPLPIIIEFWPTPFNLSSNKLFVYLPNPEITGIYPDSFIATGGTLIDVFGESLSSVAKPFIQLTVVISRADQNSSTTNTCTRICVVLPGNGTFMQCPMPPLNLPDDFVEILNLRYNTNVTRRRRSRDPINQFIPYSHNQLSRMKRDSGRVLTIQGQNGFDRADIYLGFLLDGEKGYENINDELPDTKLIFYSPPEINSTDERIEFDPSEDNLIRVKGQHMSRGCRLIDYLVHIGNQICTNIDLLDNQLRCRPPKDKPSSTSNDTIYCDQYLSISITIGYKQYQYACLAYTDHSRRLALIIGLTVGLAAFAILLTILIVFIVRCRRKNVVQETDRHQHSRGVELRNRDVINAEQQESPEDLKIIHRRHNTTTTMYKPDDVYANALQYEPQHDYDHRIEEYYENDRRCSRI